jgi:hypothetical protein
LLDAVALVTEGQADVRCSFVAEPGEHRWTFDRSGSDVVLRILAFDDLGNHEPD